MRVKSQRLSLRALRCALFLDLLRLRPPRGPSLDHNLKSYAGKLPWWLWILIVSMMIEILSVDDAVSDQDKKVSGGVVDSGLPSSAARSLGSANVFISPPVR